MVAGLETFAKVRALHDSTTNPGEKAAAATRMQTLARKAGMTVEEAVSKLDAPDLTIVASTTLDMSDAFNAFFNSPEMRADMAAREAKRKVKAAGLVDQYGSEDAIFADTPIEAAVRAACDPLLGPGEKWNTIYRLDGWGGVDSPSKAPASVRKAVSEAWPLPSTVAEAWAEYEATDQLTSDRYVIDRYCDPHSFMEVRQHILEGLCDTLPARRLRDVRARLAWLEFWAGRDVEQDVASYRATLATLRADIERMGARLRENDAETVQDGQGQGGGETPPPLDSSPPAAPVSVQTGHPARRTNAEKRADVLALMGQGLTDREIARRAGVSPQTVGNIRRSPQ